MHYMSDFSEAVVLGSCINKAGGRVGVWVAIGSVVGHREKPCGTCSGQIVLKRLELGGTLVQ